MRNQGGCRDKAQPIGEMEIDFARFRGAVKGEVGFFCESPSLARERAVSAPLQFEERGHRLGRLPDVINFLGDQ